MAVRVLDPTEYEKLEKELETALPVSLCAYSHFKLLGRGILTDKTVLVDSWPDFSAVVIVDSTKKKTMTWAISFCKGSDFCQSLENLLRHSATLLASPLAIVGKMKVTGYIIGKVPAGFKLSELKQAHVENVYNACPHRDRYEQIADLRQWIRYHIDTLPTVCIETEDGRPVAWEVQHEYGRLGMLNVEPEYRRLKLGSVVTRTLAQKLVKDGQLVFACVDDKNETSVNFHENNGYTRMPLMYSVAVYHL
ncbi:glycine N-acyltransferase-like [Saccostrea cucullata]|uniref:glycine N-acyltransferase-like n=1 Tax=Saccostrea cuccullata TaxID=36930 RepID=UPI002ED4AB73